MQYLLGVFQSRCRLFALLYGTRLTRFCRMQSMIRSAEHSRNPIKFSIADAIKMYLKKPITSLQLTSLQWNERKKKAIKCELERGKNLN